MRFAFFSSALLLTVANEAQQAAALHLEENHHEPLAYTSGQEVYSPLQLGQLPSDEDWSHQLVQRSGAEVPPGPNDLLPVATEYAQIGAEAERHGSPDEAPLTLTQLFQKEMAEKKAKAAAPKNVDKAKGNSGKDQQGEQ